MNAHDFNKILNLVNKLSMEERDSLADRLKHVNQRRKVFDLQDALLASDANSAYRKFS